MESKTNLIIEKNDFEILYNKILKLFKLGKINAVDISEIALLAMKYGYEPDYNFELKKPKICECRKYSKIISNEGFLCGNCHNPLNKKNDY